MLCNQTLTFVTVKCESNSQSLSATFWVIKSDLPVKYTLHPALPPKRAYKLSMCDYARYSHCRAFWLLCANQAKRFIFNILAGVPVAIIDLAAAITNPSPIRHFQISIDVAAAVTSFTAGIEPSYLL